MHLKEKSLKQFAPIRFRLVGILALMPATIGILLGLLYGSAPQKFDAFVAQLGLFGRLYPIVFQRYLLIANADMPSVSRMNVDGAVLLTNLLILLLQMGNLSSAIVSYRPVLAKWSRQRFRMSAGAYCAPMKTGNTVMAAITLISVVDLLFGGLLIHYLEFQFVGSLTSFGAFLYRVTLLFCLLQIFTVCSLTTFAFSVIDP